MRKLVLIAALASMAAAQAQHVDYNRYPDYTPQIKAEKALMQPRKADARRPAYVNNAETPYFPPVINQVGGSCGSASRIGYMFAYEINSYRGVAADNDEAIYPTHFTWLLTNSGSGKDAMAKANGIPNVAVYGGRTTSKYFGIQDTRDVDFGWMQGYDRWYHAMCNRLDYTANFPVSVETEEGREAVKNWIWNHNGDTTYHAGGICGIGMGSAGIWQNIPQSTVNDELGVTGKYFVKTWGATVDHAMTIVGYDDRIQFDLDGNGIVGETDKDEVGAWIIANSWGSDWCNKGFIYCPYKYGTSVGAGSSGNYYRPEVYHIRKDYRPLRTLRIRMDYSKRSEIKLSAGISADLDAQMPDNTTDFEHFKYAGDGNGDGIDAATPMLGRWADGMHYEPMEFGYDLTDLSAAYDTRRPLKYFFVIDTKTSASGVGNVYECALVDYEFDKEGIETPFIQEGQKVEIQNKGQQTILSVVVSGEPLHAPRNARMSDGRLQWEAPVASSYNLLGYRILHGGRTLAEVAPATSTYQSPSDSIQSLSLAALYQNGTDTLLSSIVSSPLPATDFCGKKADTTFVRNFKQAGFTILKMMEPTYQKWTMEYWIKPTTLTNYNQQIGPGWGQFLAHTTNQGEYVVGWNTGQRVTTAPGSLVVGQWTHVAVVIDGGHLTCYLNGRKAGECTGSTTGIGGFGDLTFGFNGTNGLNAQIEEVRFWKTARSEHDIRSMMYYEVANPTTHPDLLAEFRMDEKATLPDPDATGHYTTKKYGSQPRATDKTVLKDTRVLKADFEMPAAPVAVGATITPTNTSTGAISRTQWTLTQGTEVTTYDLEDLTLLFDRVGEATLSLTVWDIHGDSMNIKKTFSIQAQSKPQAAFQCQTQVARDHRISFTNTTTLMEGTRFQWSMPGAVVENVHTVNAAAVYKEAGTYVVTLTATNAAGVSTTQQTVRVTTVAPEAAFDVQPATILKGQSIQLRDASRYEPTSWSWSLTDRAHRYVFNTQNADLTLDHPGTYTLSLEATNSVGTGRLTQPRAVTVCNADGQTGLNFSGKTGQRVTFDNPLRLDETHAFTIDWWMYVKATGLVSHHIGGTESDLVISVTDDGVLSFVMGGFSSKTPVSTVIPLEWHHYAITFRDGEGFIYVDGKPVSDVWTPWIVKNPTMPQQFTIGSDDAPMNAVIDEFRIWNSQLTADVLRHYANQPITDVAAARRDHQLALYFPFNQNSGNVIDACGGPSGVRQGFGPDGDAWTPTLGIFCLSDAQRHDVSAHYLTNYQQPFQAATTSISSQGTQYKDILQDDEFSRWQVRNPYVDGQTRTQLAVDTEQGNLLSLVTKLYDFNAEVFDHQFYQTVTLPAGHYVFGIERANRMDDDQSYLVVARGSEFPLTANLPATALAFDFIDEGEVAFSLYEETQVSLGLLMNTVGERTQNFSRFFLETKTTNDDFTWTDIPRVEVLPEVSAPAPLYDLTGRPVLHPVKGRLYIRRGKKILW